MPLISTAVIDSLIEVFAQCGRITVPVHGGRRGHPLLVPQSYFAEILTSFDGVGLRGLLQVHADEIHELNIDDSGVLHDMAPPHTRSVFERWREFTTALEASASTTGSVFRFTETQPPLSISELEVRWWATQAFDFSSDSFPSRSRLGLRLQRNVSCRRSIPRARRASTAPNRVW